MDEHLLQACPSVIVLISPGTRTVQSHLVDLLGLVDPVIREAIAIVELTMPADTPSSETRIARIIGDENHLTLAMAIEAAINQVQGQRTHDRLAEAGYHVVDGAQFYIVLDHAVPAARTWGGIALAMIRQITEQHFEVQRRVAYVLLHLPDAYNRHTPRESYTAIAPRTALERQSADFIYIYDAISSNLQQAIATRTEVEYDCAEAIFALVATALPEAASIENAMRALRERTAPQTFAPFIGNLCTTMVRFPRSTVQAYVSADLAAQVMADWVPGMGELTPGTQGRYQALGQTDAQAMRTWLSDAERRPGTLGDRQQSAHRQAMMAQDTPVGTSKTQMATPRHLWPTLQIPFYPDPGGSPPVRQDVAKLDRAAAWMRRIFQPIAPQAIEHAWDSTHALEKACALLSQQASEGFDQWIDAAPDAWQDVARVVIQQTQQRVLTLWRESPTSGAHHALFYVRSLSDEVQLLAAELPAQRTTHTEAYRDAVIDFERRTVGPWVNRPNAPQLLYDRVAQQITPQAAPRYRLSQAHGEAVEEEFPRLAFSEREQYIAEQLRHRVQWERAHVPTALGLGALFLAGGTTSLVALITVGFARDLLGWLTLIVMTLFLGGIPPIISYRRRFARYRVALTDLTGFYMASFAYRCECQEDRWREVFVLGPLREELQRIQERLEHMAAFYRAVADLLKQRSDTIQRTFFDHPAAARDVFIANGQRLRSQGHLTLDSIARILDGRRGKRFDGFENGLAVTLTPMDLGSIRDQVLHALQTDQTPGGRSLFTLTVEDAEAIVLRLTNTLVAIYLSDPQDTLTNLQSALDDPDVQRWIEDRLTRIRFASGSDHLRQFTLIAGRAADQHHFHFNDFEGIPTNQREWVILIRLTQGGDPERIDTDRLFPTLGQYRLDSDAARRDR